MNKTAGFYLRYCLSKHRLWTSVLDRLLGTTAPNTPFQGGGDLRTRNIRFQLRLTKKEADLLQKQSLRCGITRQAYLISLLKNTPIKEQPSADFIAILKALEKIGDNINQIAAKANALGFIDKVQYRKDAEKLEKVVAELIRVAYT